MSYLDPGLARHVPFLHLVASERASSVMLRSLPGQVDMLSSHLQNLEVLWSAGRRWTMQTKTYLIKNKSYLICTVFSSLICVNHKLLQINCLHRHIVSTNDVDFNLSRDRCDIVLQVQGVDAFVWADAWRNNQFCECGLSHHGDPFVIGGQLLLSEGPLGDGGRVSADWDSDG